ncbi:MAG: histidine kinase [Flavobacteriales bacterium]|nr:histidine kinase [Flavobacteriales bacterium]
MLIKKKLYWFAQLFGWLVYVLIVGVFNKLNGNDLTVELLYSLFSIFLIGLSVSHFYRAIIIKLNWMSLSVAHLIPRVIISILFLGVIVYILQTLIIEIALSNYDYTFVLADAFPKIINWSLLLLLWSLLYFLFHFINNYKKEEIKNLKWEAARNEIELNKIKSQLNPHFIFNSMNSIRALVDENPDLAKNAITQLSNVLRNSLLMGKKKLVPLGDELKIVDDYLSLEKTRFEEKLNIIKKIEPNTETFLVPPLMIQTIVENGIKHGTSKLAEGGSIEIQTKLMDDKLVITIYNSGRYDESKIPETGFGILNTIQRLQLLFGNAAKFTIENENNRVKAQLIIPSKTQL